MDQATAPQDSWSLLEMTERGLIFFRMPLATPVHCQQLGVPRNDSFGLRVFFCWSVSLEACLAGQVLSSPLSLSHATIFLFVPSKTRRIQDST